MSAALAEALRSHGGPLAELSERFATSRSPNVRGPRTAGREPEYELLLEMIREGARLHYEPWVDDRELALLLGDRLYALGLARLATLGEVEAVAELADVISLVAQAEAADDRELAQAAWQAGAAAIARGSSAEHEAAKDRARAGDPEAAEALRAIAAEAL